VIRQQAQKTSLLGLLTCFVVGAIVGTATGARAEGSRTLYPKPSSVDSRANLEWRPADLYGNLLPRSSLMKVYARKDEYILLGSSAVGVGLGDISVFYPATAGTQQLGDAAFNTTIPDFKCSAQRTQVGSPLAMGKITTRTMELKGPNPTIASNGYTPCYIKAPSDGIYSVVFLGPKQQEIKPPADIDLTDSRNFDDQQGYSVSAWDITVRSDLASLVDINGRVFSYNLALFTGDNGRPITFNLYPVTNDGYRYELGLRNLDPNGFLLYGNQVGFFDQDGKTPLYHDLSASDNLITTPAGGAKIAAPQFPIFLNPVDSSILSQLNTYDIQSVRSSSGIPLSPPTLLVSNFAFSGNQTVNSSVINSPNFGKFTFDTNNFAPVNYEIFIFRDGTGCDSTAAGYDPSRSNCDPTQKDNRSIRGVIANSGSQTVPWDGKDNEGNNFPVGLNYKTIIKLHGGEYHFPILDPENNQNGGITVKALNGGNLNSTDAYYDDRGYRTVNVYNPATGALITPGQLVGTIGSVLPVGNTPPSQTFSNMVTGFDSSKTLRKYGDGSKNGFGDKKGLDLWTYLSSNVVVTPLNIVAAGSPQVTLVKRVTKVQSMAIPDLVDQIGGTGDTNENNVLWPNLTGTATKVDNTTGASLGTTGNFSTLLQGATVLSALQAPRPKEELEYTIYYLSHGSQTAKNAVICDFIPVNTTYVAGTLQLKNGPSAAVPVSDATGDADGGFYPIGTAQAAMHAACNTPDSTNTTRGAVVVNLGDVLNATSTGTPTSSYGYIRFRVVVQ
jgi:uncharacterized repeat protein (TIGR01451 family)